MKKYFPLMGLLAFAVAGCAEQDLTATQITDATIMVDGSSTVYPITLQAANRFLNTHDASISVNYSGSSAGFRAFCRGETDVSNASRPINDEERAMCQENNIAFLTLPVAMDAMAIVVNPKNTWVDDISMAELNTMWSAQSEGKINEWQQVRAEWPDKPLSLYGRGQDSGTYDYFTTHVTGETRQSRHDYVASEDEEFLAAQIAEDENAIGFFGIGAYHRHWDTLKVIPVDNGQGAVYPSIETVADGSYQPFTRPLFLYVNKASLKEKANLKPFLQHYFTNLRSWLHFTGYMPIAETNYQDNLSKLQ